MCFDKIHSPFPLFQLFCFPHHHFSFLIHKYSLNPLSPSMCMGIGPPTGT